MRQPQRDILVLPGELPDADLVGALGTDLGAGIAPLHLDLQSHGQGAAFEMLDTHPGSVRRAGQLLLRSGGTLFLLAETGGLTWQDASRDQNFVAQMAEGPVRSALRHVPPLRSLRGAGTGTIRHRDLSVTDDEGKTRARARLVSLVPAGGGRAVTIAALQPLRGYDAALDRLRAHLGAVAGGGAETIPDLASTLFPDRDRYDAKPAIAIDAGDPALDVATAIIAAYLEVARRNEAGIVADHDTEFLHDHRVALRKVRSVLSLLKGVHSDARNAQLRRMASDLMAPTGRLRDLDVYLLARDDYFAMLPPSLHPGLELLFEMFLKERRKAHRALSVRLRSEGYRAAISALQRAVAAPDPAARGPLAEAAVGPYASGLIWRRYRKVCRLARAITDETPDAEVHELRIGCKKLRYLMEVFAPLYPGGAMKPILKPLKRLQDNLGLFNDYSVQQAFLQDVMEHHDRLDHRQDLALAQSIGALIAVLHERQMQERARIMSSVTDFVDAGFRDRCRALFHDKEG